MQKHYSVRTDLAIEAIPLDEEERGVEITREKFKGGSISRVRIINEEGGRQLGKPMGMYITIDCPGIMDGDATLKHQVSKQIAKEITSLWSSLTQGADKEITVLVVGLGNWNVTPDALGPKVVQDLLVTRHLLTFGNATPGEGLHSVCAVAPGVLGLTGIETGEIIVGIVDKVKPDLVIAVDALASRSVERVGTTVQMADTGINPGSGLGNKRKALNRETLGVPVIAIGVPTVVYAATIARDAVENAVFAMSKRRGGNGGDERIGELTPDMKQELLHNLLSPHAENLVVTPKEIDAIIDSMSKVVAGGINVALHPSLSLRDTLYYM
ncbi:MAG: GPR endopeptidase [Peptococcaceae bacterium]|nr:GPR endopeptidase [Peptococcaceae bacterium]